MAQHEDLVESENPPREENKNDSGGWTHFFIKCFLVYSFVNFGVKYHTNRVKHEQEMVIQSGVLTQNQKMQVLMQPHVFPVHNPLSLLPEVRDEDGEPIQQHACLWMSNTKMILRVYITEFTDFNLKRDSRKLVWEENNLMLLPDESNHRSFDTNVSLSYNMREGEAFAHVFLFHETLLSIDPSHKLYNPQLITHRHLSMTKVTKVTKRAHVKSLLGEEEEIDNKVDRTMDDTNKKRQEDVSSEVIDASEQVEVEEEDEEYVVLWKPLLSIRMVTHFSRYPRNSIPTAFSQYMSFDYQTGFYFPIIYLEEFWLMEKNMITINRTGSIEQHVEVPLQLSYSEISPIQWQLQTQMEQQWAAQEVMGVARSGEIDGIRQLLIDTDPKLIVLTVVVSLLHTLFNFLAFSNDVKFYRQIKDFSGLSLRSMVLNCFFRTVILLYLFDNDTSWLVKTSSSVGLAIEYWKIAKSVNMELLRTSFGWNSRSSQSEPLSESSSHDKVATDHLLFVVYPLVLGYSIYTLMYSKYKSWYSWVISSLVGFIYVFGFVMMTPQLFINYKLKSVAHLPWRAMIYKSINTFIDDLFAFVIEMPTMHRIACLRDDLIFFVYLYQRWIYPIDKKRMNEFGQEFEQEAELESDSAGVVLGLGQDDVHLKSVGTIEDDSEVGHTSEDEDVVKVLGEKSITVAKGSAYKRKKRTKAN